MARTRKLSDAQLRMLTRISARQGVLFGVAMGNAQTAALRTCQSLVDAGVIRRSSNGLEYELTSEGRVSIIDGRYFVGD